MRKYRRAFYKERLVFIIIFVLIICISYIYGKFTVERILLSAFSISIIFSLYKRQAKKRYLKYTISEIDNLSGEAFELYLYFKFKEFGYKAYLTPKTADYGGDLVIRKGFKKIVIQAKRWRNTVGVSAVQEVNSAINYYGASKGIVITNSYFSTNAKTLAEANQVELIDRYKLIKLMKATKFTYKN